MANASNDDVYLRISVNIFSEGRRQENCPFSAYVYGREVSEWVSEWANHKVASNQLKIGYQVAYGYAVIATWGFRARQNSYGFRAIWSWKFWTLEKNRSFAHGPGGSPIEKRFGTIKGLPICFNRTEGIFASQKSYGFTAIYLVLGQEKKVKFFSEQGGYL